MNQASVSECHKRFKEGRESVRYDERCRRSKEVNTPELIGQSVRVTMLRFLREFRKRFRRKRPGTLQIGSEGFLPGQYTSLQLHPCHRLFDQDGHQDSSSVSL